MSSHSCQHHHDHRHHNHAHHSHIPNNKRVLLISFILITIFMYIEFIGGYFSNSLALIADAGHMLTDALSLGLAVFAMMLSHQKPRRNYTFGYQRAEILAATFNGILLFGVSFYITYEAIERIFIKPEILSFNMLVIAVIGLLVNVIVAVLMWYYGDTVANLNVRAAFLHVIADMLGSVGAIIAALLIILFDWQWADTFASVVVAIVVLKSAFYVLKNALHILMQGVPQHIDTLTIKRTLLQHHFVKGIRQLHLWQVNNDYHILTCHIKVTSINDTKDYHQKLQQLITSVSKYDIQEVTIQLEVRS